MYTKDASVEYTCTKTALIAPHSNVVDAHLSTERENNPQKYKHQSWQYTTQFIYKYPHANAAAAFSIPPCRLEVYIRAIHRFDVTIKFVKANEVCK